MTPLSTSSRPPDDLKEESSPATSFSMKPVLVEPDAVRFVFFDDRPCRAGPPIPTRSIDAVLWFHRS